MLMFSLPDDGRPYVLWLPTPPGPRNDVLIPSKPLPSCSVLDMYEYSPRLLVSSWPWQRIQLEESSLSSDTHKPLSLSILRCSCTCSVYVLYPICLQG